MKKFLLWQFGILCLLTLVYTIYLSLGADQYRAVFYSMIGVGIGTIAGSLLFGVRVRPSLELRSEWEKGSSIIAALVIGVLCVWVANICGASVFGDILAFTLVFLLTLAIPAEVTIAMIALILIFFVAFGDPLPASIVIFGLAIFWGMALRSQGFVIKKSVLFLCSGAQAVLTYLIFTHDMRLFILKFLG